MLDQSCVLSRAALQGHIESAHKFLRESAPDTLTIEEWQAIIASYNGQCALCEMNPIDRCTIWVPVDGLVAGNVAPLCKACYHHKEHSFLSAMERVRAQLDTQTQMIARH